MAMTVTPDHLSLSLPNPNGTFTATNAGGSVYASSSNTAVAAVRPRKMSNNLTYVDVTAKAVGVATIHIVGPSNTVDRPVTVTG